MSSDNNKEEQYLFDLGFVEEFFDDKSASWYVKRMKSKYFDRCEIYINNMKDTDKKTNISVFTDDKESKIFINHAQIISKDYSRKTLNKIIDLINWD